MYTAHTADPRQSPVCDIQVTPKLKNAVIMYQAFHIFHVPGCTKLGNWSCVC